MVDPISVEALTALVSGVLGGATGEAGAELFRGVRDLVRRGGGDDVLVEQLEAGEVVDAVLVAERMLTAVRGDPQLTGDLRAWVRSAQTVVTDASTNNSVDGTVGGSVVQGRDFSGPINLG